MCSTCAKENGGCSINCNCFCHQPRGPRRIIDEADKQLALYPPVAYTPDWHPYYWLGQRDAARSRNCSLKSYNMKT